MNTTKIGWAGLGNMGIPMAENLIKAGYPLSVFNRSNSKTAALTAIGAAIADSPAQLLQQSEVVIIMVSDDQAIRELFTGATGFLSANDKDKIFINMSSVSPDISKEMDQLCKAQNNSYIDAPVSGSVKQAIEGQLVIMVGGDNKIYETVKPILEKLGKLTMLVGPTGAGNTAKLAINTLLAIQAQGLAEAIVFARDNGVATADLLTLINNSALGNIFMKIKGEAILQDNYKAAFALKHIAKDLRLAKQEGLHSPLADIAFTSFQNAEPLLGEEDIIAIIKQL